MKTPTDTDPASWQRHFAMRANNLAWSLAEQGERDAAADRQLLDAAHASAWLWGQVGTEQHRMRATMLLAQVHSLLGLAATAWSYANEMRAYFLAQPDTPDWELAFVHAIHAHAAHASGRAGEHASSYAQAQQALAAIADAQDRQIVEATFRLVPAP